MRLHKIACSRLVDGAPPHRSFAFYRRLFPYRFLSGPPIWEHERTDFKDAPGSPFQNMKAVEIGPINIKIECEKTRPNVNILKKIGLTITTLKYDTTINVRNYTFVWNTIPMADESNLSRRCWVARTRVVILILGAQSTNRKLF